MSQNDSTTDPALGVILAGMQRDADAEAAEARVVLWQAAALLGWLVAAAAVVTFLAVS